MGVASLHVGQQRNLVNGDDFFVTELLCFMGECGFRYKESELRDIYYYVKKMVKDRRVIAVKDGERYHTVIFYSIAQEWEPYLKKGEWEYATHQPGGCCIYIEKAVSKGWNKYIRNSLKQIILDKYPQLHMAKWHRYGNWGDRAVTRRS